MIYVGPKSFRNNPTLMSELAQAFPYETITNSPLDAQAAIIGLDKVDDNFLVNNPNLRFISKYGVGMDNIDVESCERRWVRVLHTPGVNAPYVAEHTLGLILSLLRKINQGVRHTIDGDWVKEGGISLEGLYVGVIGYGNIGRRVYRLLEQFGAKVSYNDIDDGLVKQFLFEHCDILTLHVPLTDRTKYLVNRDTLTVMKPTAYLINTSRGAVVDQEALKWALKNKIIAGAALDVFEHEPCNDEELLNMENVICTPHVAGNSEQSVLAMGRAAIENLKRMVKP